MASHLLTYSARAARHSNPAARQLLEVIERKQSNLCVSVDVVKKADFLAIIDAVGSYAALIKAFPTFLALMSSRAHIVPP
jgi:orotidine-5'-phosphate decarboxylase